jgi:predicted amidophosphoribosyltransferase
MAAPRAEKGLLAEILLPGRCLLCGRWLLFEGRAGLPVCAECQDGMAPITGPRCAICSMTLAGERDLCMRCRSAGYAFECNHSLFAYAGEVRDLIVSYKLGGRVRVARLFAPLLARVIHERHPGRPVVPVPPRPGRRGPDAVERIARLLEREHGLPMCRCLARAGGAPQKSLDFASRRENLQGKISVLPGLAGGGVPAAAVLLDDVFTTGATADACARALAAAGCAAVAVLTIAVD